MIAIANYARVNHTPGLTLKSRVRTNRFESGLNHLGSRAHRIPMRASSARAYRGESRDARVTHKSSPGVRSSPGATRTTPRGLTDVNR